MAKKARSQSESPQTSTQDFQLIVADLRTRNQALEHQNDVLSRALRTAKLAREAGRMGTWHLDFASDKLELSDEIFALLDIDPLRWAGSPTAFEAYVHPEDREKRRKDRSSAFASSDHLSHDFRTLASDGAVHWFSARGAIVRDDSGNPLESYGVLADITERKNVEERLRRSEFVLQAATENAGVGLALLDSTRRCVFANRAYSQMLDLPHDLVGTQAGTHTERLLPGQVGPRLDLAFDGQRVSNEFDQLNSNGEQRNLTVVYEPMRDAADNVSHVVVVLHDVSDSRLAQHRIAESEERLRMANEAAGIGTFAIDAKSGVAQYSPELMTILGVPGAKMVKVEQALGRVHRDDLARVRSLYDAAQDPAGDGHLLMEFRFVRPGGEVRWMTWSGRFEFTDNGGKREATRIVGACIDITQRKQAEVALRGSESRYRGVVEGSLQGIVIQQDGKIVYANSAMARIFGYDSPDALLGQSTFDAFIAADERAVLRARTAAAYRGEMIMPHPGWRGFRRDGSEIWLTTMAHLAEWQGQPAIVSFYHDITQRKINERRLNETLRLMKVACAAGRMGTWHFDPSGATLNYSDEGLELLGIDRTTWDGTLQAVEAVVHPDDVAKHRRAIAEALAAQIDLEMEFRILRPDQSIRWIMVRGHVVKRAESRKFDALGVILDITERKQAEERQQFLIRELDHRVKNSLTNIQLVMERSREKTNSLDEFKAALEGRLMSMVRTHSRLSKGGWKGVSLSDIIRDALLPYANDSNTAIEGPQVLLKPKASQAVAMAVFELATNAAKYGALSRTTGQIKVTWHVMPDRTTTSQQRASAPKSQPAALVINWQESGGPKIELPVPEGYGTDVIRSLVPYELKGAITLQEFNADGVRCTFTIPSRFLVTALD